MSSLLYKCVTKATTAEGDQLRYSPNWLIARRAILKIFDDHLECGNWTVDYATIRDAALYSVRSSLWLPGYVLRIETPDKTYHFGLNWGSFWKGDLPFPARRERGRLGYSWFSVIYRIILLGFLLYFAWTWLKR